MKTFLRILLASALLLPCMSRAAGRPDQFPRTNTFSPGDLILKTELPDSSGSRRDRGVMASNFPPALASLAAAAAPSVTNTVYAATDAAWDGNGSALSPRAIGTQSALSNLFWTIPNGTRLVLSGTNLPVVAVEGYTGDGNAITNGAIRIAGKSDITIEGGSFSFGEYGDLFNFSSVTNLTIRDMRVTGVRLHERTNTQTAVFELNAPTRGVHFDSVTISDFPHHGICHRGTSGDHDGLFVERCYFFNGGNTNHPSLNGDGAAVVVSGSVTSSRVQDNLFDRCLRGVEIYTYPSLTLPMRNVNVSANTMTNMEERGVITLSDQTNAVSQTNVRIVGNRITMNNTNIVVPGTTQSGISASAGSTGLVISDNTITSAPGDGSSDDYGISVTASQGQIDSPTISGNRVFGYWASRGIQLYGTANTSGGSFYKVFNGRVLDNFVDTSNTGYLIGGNNTEVRGNVVRNWSTSGYSFDEARDLRAGYNASVKQASSALVIAATTTNVTAWNNNWAGYVTSSGVGVTLDQTSPYTWLAAGSVTLTNGGLVTAAGPQILSVTNNTAPNGSLFLDATGILWTRTNSAWVIK